MELRDALTQITEIRLQMARATLFRGYRSVPTAFSGFLAVIAASIQERVAPQPTSDPTAYLALWVGIAAVSLLAAGTEMAIRYRRATTSLERETTRLAVGQFIPAVAAGALVTGVLAAVAPESLWVLPGLWAVFFGMGIFATYRLLPRATFWVGIYYFAAGAVCLVFGRGEQALAPWTMATSFGGGQLITAAILYWTLERNDARQ